MKLVVSAKEGVFNKKSFSIIRGIEKELGVEFSVVGEALSGTPTLAIKVGSRKLAALLAGMINDRWVYDPQVPSLKVARIFGDWTEPTKVFIDSGDNTCQIFSKAERVSCPSCPHIVGDAYLRDCCFLDCLGGWEQAFLSLEEAYAKTLVTMEEVLMTTNGCEEVTLPDGRRNVLGTFISTFIQMRTETDRGTSK